MMAEYSNSHGLVTYGSHEPEPPDCMKLVYQNNQNGSMDSPRVAERSDFVPLAAE